MEQLQHWLMLAAMPGINGLKLEKLLPHITIAELVALPVSTLCQIGFTPRQAELFCINRQRYAGQGLNWLQQQPDHHVITFTDSRYPALLKQTKHPPILLFVKGSVAVLSQQQLAMVGSRLPTPAGRNIARQFAGELTQQGFVITSGMARGIDSASHQGALQAQGITIAVLGNGLNQIYPKSNLSLAAQISEQGALVSEYFPDVPPKADHFPQRNRIVVGMSIGTIVVEAALKSGSLISAHLAAEYSREVFAVPGSIYNPQVAGCHYLIQQGAKLVTSVADILDEWRFFAKNDLNNVIKEQKNTATDLSADPLLANVGDDATAIDTIAERAGMSVADTTVALLELELSGAVAAVPGGYIRVRST